MDVERDRAGADLPGADVVGLERAALRLGALGGLQDGLAGQDGPGREPGVLSPLLLRDLLLCAADPGLPMAMPAAPAGLSPSLRDLLVCEALGPGDRPPAAVHLLANTIHAAEIGLSAVTSQGHAALAVPLLREMHAALCHGLAVPGRGGMFRPAMAGGPMEPSIEALLSGLAGPDSHAPLLLRMAQLGAGFAELAPFEFGSPVLARLLPGLLAACEGFVPVVVAPIPDRRSASGFQSYFDAIALAAQRAHRLALDIARCREDWLRRLIALRSDANARRLIDLLVDRPVITAGGAGRWLGVSFQTANAAVAALVAHDILAPLGGLRRNRVFVATELFRPAAPAGAPLGVTALMSDRAVSVWPSRSDRVASSRTDGSCIAAIAD